MCLTDVARRREDTTRRLTWCAAPVLAFPHSTADVRSALQILILDVARFKYPSYWISVDSAFAAMQGIDKATGQPRSVSLPRFHALAQSDRAYSSRRGYAMLSVLPSSNPSSISSPLSLTSLALNKSSYASLSTTLSRILLSVRPDTPAHEVLASLREALDALPTSVVIPRSSPEEPPASKQPSIEGSVATSSRDAGLASLSAALTSCHFPLAPPSASHAATASSQPLQFLFLLALLSHPPSLALISAKPREALEALVRDALKDSAIRSEVEVVRGQIVALSECCRDEGEQGSEGGGAACGCKAKVM